ncbi:nucleoside phosphorylase [Paenimyroides aestuarii]|uniref:Uridine phosphorylase n=1 Tax=Paenimyroides aestuarii TaxID=2968490 RepID=A0ABY5NQG1_9FLAO|nr:nucleoside phosphorylase [Paenimyroides aestuarii]UUV20811.1 nucleoside phosphorylase [Paenimyroides aestuarii]
MQKIKDSELILNPDGSVYHLNLKPQDIANDIIFVGDQDRVASITKYFDSIEFSTQKREFKTETGIYKGKRITVISTGIGPDNIDIVLNELDALVNIDFATKTVKPNLTSLNIVRVGTSGSLQTAIPVDSLLMSAFAIGTDNMLRSYELQNIQNQSIEKAFVNHTNWDLSKGLPYVISADNDLLKKFQSDRIFEGITITAPGFYGAQGRILRLPLQDAFLNDKIDSFAYKGLKATNLEMETAAIYGLAKLLGHRALSLNAIVANRKNGTFSADPYKTIDALICFTLDRILA